MSDLIRREALPEKYDAAHEGPPGGVRKLTEEAPAADVTALAEELMDRGSVVALFYQDKTGEWNTTALQGNSRLLIAALAAMWGSMAENLPKKEIERAERGMRCAIRDVKKKVYKKKAGGSADANGRV